MLTIEECKKYLQKYNLSNQQIEEIRNTLYCMAENIIEDYIKRKTDNEI